MTLQERAKLRLRKYLYPISIRYPEGKLLHGGLTRASEALGVNPSTVRKWCEVGIDERSWIPSRAMAQRVMVWISTRPKIIHHAGRPCGKRLVTMGPKEK